MNNADKLRRVHPRRAAGGFRIAERGFLSQDYALIGITTKR